MSGRRVSVALDDAVATGAAEAASRAGMSLSAWLNRAAEHQLSIEQGLAAVSEWEAEHGQLTAAELAAADQILGRVLGDAARHAS